MHINANIIKSKGVISVEGVTVSRGLCNGAALLFICTIVSYISAGNFPAHLVHYGKHDSSLLSIDPDFSEGRIDNIGYLMSTLSDLFAGRI